MTLEIRLAFLEERWIYSIAVKVTGQRHHSANLNFTEVVCKLLLSRELDYAWNLDLLA